MTGNVVGEPFDQYVFNQIKNRQNLQGKGFDLTRSTQDINYLNNRNAWVKLASSVLVENTSVTTNEPLKTDGEQRLIDLGIPNPKNYMGDKLAKSFILFNGTQELNKTGNSSSYTVREGIAKTESALNNIFSPNAYGLGGSNQGIQPMPGIESVNIDCVNRGSIRKATVVLKVYNRVQFHIIELLYLRLGFTMLLEWGWDKYLHQDKDSNVGVRNMGNTLTEDFWFTDNTCGDITQSDIINEIEDYREEYQGNYDGFYGKVTNYSWDFNKDGSYNITLDLVTIGDVIESLKINTPSSLSDSSIKELDKKIEEGKKLSGNLLGLESSKIIDVSTSNIIGSFLYLKIKNYENDTKDFIKISNEFLSFDDQSFNESLANNNQQGQTIKPPTPYLQLNNQIPNKFKFYIRFGDFLNFIKREVLNKQYNQQDDIFLENILDIRTDKDHLYKRYPNQISINPKICLVPPNIKDKNINKNQLGKLKEKNLVKALNKSLKLEEGLYTQKTGALMDIYLNVEFISSQILENTDKDENLFLFKFLEGICDGINNSLGTLNKIQPIIDKDKIVKFIDETLSFEEVYSKEDKKREEVNLEIYGYNVKNNTSNFVKDISFKTKLGPEIASTISIGATAEGNNTQTIDGTSFSKWNNGLKDKFNRVINSPTLQKLQELNKRKEDLRKIYNENFKSLNSEPYIKYNKKEFKGKKYGEVPTNITSISQNKSGFSASKRRNASPSDAGEDNFIEDALLWDQEVKSFNVRELDKNGFPIGLYLWDHYLVNCFGGNIKVNIIENNKIESKNITIETKDIRYFELNDSFISKGIQLYKEYIKNYYQTVYNKIQQPSSTIGFIPVTFDITTEGLSGVKIYQKLNIRQEFLPPQYPKALKFLITKVNHEISNNNWDTKLTTISTSNIDPEKVEEYEKEVIKKNTPSKPKPIDYFFPEGVFILKDRRDKNNPSHISGYKNNIITPDYEKFVNTEINRYARESFLNFFQELDKFAIGGEMWILTLDRTFKKSIELKNKNSSNAIPGRSAHNYNAAIDINFFNFNNNIKLTKKSPKEKWEASGIPFIAKNAGLRWGGDFANYYDPIHFAFPINVDNTLQDIETQFGVTNLYKDFNKINPLEVNIT